MHQKLKLNIHFTKSFKRDNICKLCFWMPEERNCLILTSWHVRKLRYRAHAKNVNLSYIAQNHSSMSILKYLLHRRKMNITVETSYHDIELIISVLKRLLQFMASFKRDDIHKLCVVVKGEHTFLTRKRFFEKNHSCGFVFQKQPMFATRYKMTQA